MEKKNFLFVSLTGLSSDIACQASKEGHEARYFIGDKKEGDIADGFVAKSKDWEKDIDWADTIIFDGTLGQGEKGQDLRKQGKKVIGGTPYSDEWEDNRSFGQNNDAQATRVRSGIPVGILVAVTCEAAYRSIFRKQRCAYMRDTVIEFCPEVPQ
jgi:hypothetical protein